MRSGAKSLAHFIAVLGPAAVVVFLVTGGMGVFMIAAAAVWMVMKFCNSIDRQAIEQEDDPQGSETTDEK